MAKWPGTRNRRFVVLKINPDADTVSAVELEGDVRGKVRYFTKANCHVDQKATKALADQ